MLQDPRSLLQLAEERRRSGRHKEAIAVCLEGLARHPNLDAVRVTLGRSYLESGQSAEARDALREVYSRQPDHHLAGKLLAEALKRLGDLEGAATTCREILRHYPRDRELEALLASVEPAPAQAPKAAAPPAPKALAPPASDPSPDYLPEDIAAAGPAPNRIAEVASAPAPSRSPEIAPAPPPERRVEPVPASVPAPEARASGDALQTYTLAELYAKQGLVDRALEVYRGMSRLDPENAALRRRIQELETIGTREAAPAPVAAPSPAAMPAAARQPSLAAPPSSKALPSPAASPARAQAASSQPAAAAPDVTAPSGRTGAAGIRESAAIERLERWLDTIRSSSEGRGRAGASR
jgi:tetratricopeptide (TPR) repeat protein